MATDSSEPPQKASLLGDDEKGVPVSQPPLTDLAVVVGDRGDASRHVAGMLLIALGIGFFGGTLWWTLSSLTLEFQPSLAPSHLNAQHMMGHFVARAGIVAVAATFSYGLIRAGERLTMTQARYIETLQWTKRGRTKDEALTMASDLVQLAVDLVRDESKPPRD